MGSSVTFQAQDQSQMVAITFDSQTRELMFEIDKKTSRFALQHTWWNGVPAAHDSSFNETTLPTLKHLKMEINGEELHLNNPTFQLFNLQIQTNSATHQLKTSPSLTVEGLKIQIKKFLPLSVIELSDSEELHLENHPLTDELTLEECSILENSLLKLAPKQRSTKAASSFDSPGNDLETGFTLLTFNLLKGGRVIPLNPNAPKWQIIEPGLSFIGTCTTAMCAAKDQKVFVPRGFGTFKLADGLGNLSCPECKSTLTQIDDGLFWDCTYSIEGKREEDFTLTKEENKEVPSKHALGFSYQPAQWEYLNITVTKKRSSFFTWQNVVAASSIIAICVLLFGGKGKRKG